MAHDCHIEARPDARARDDIQTSKCYRRIKTYFEAMGNCNLKLNFTPPRAVGTQLAGLVSSIIHSFGQLKKENSVKMTV